MIVDARGHRCPTPGLKLQKAMREAGPAARLTLLATDPMARIDVPHLMAGLGGAVVSIDEAGGVLTIVVETPGAPTG
ncbi:MAG: sulfurtransferase TusA family protein [Brevundimonas sp.]|uniref:sulfurtransferase TusA family protein n=1 Tax=Brevundimonas sp. TaxID=1871086 RepID=UPI002725FD29|nr:sulfurtransferase TusA family protein [Brevundimonas sp.]MDO9589476.1 sulfurtransferase TusA family protein [Brevundimonas sp.]MDP3368837.1 sulfurtransferase TusA family protein [Brevundimonas sp.]MDP3656527.1 sulfurtransferase TusA family protein [Brevundimonas sp.]MDZ4113314.1 sulfurtransferase TusA family protein [Brevundimonas sp.]